MERQDGAVLRARSAPRTARHARRILLVDDAKDCREALAQYLELQGHRVCTAANGLEGLTAASRFHPEVAFLDLYMPRMDGFELCTRLRERDETKEAAVFALTAHRLDARSLARVRGGFDAYLTKPVEFEVIAGLINTAAALDVG